VYHRAGDGRFSTLASVELSKVLVDWSCVPSGGELSSNDSSELACCGGVNAVVWPAQGCSMESFSSTPHRANGSKTSTPPAGDDVDLQKCLYSCADVHPCPLDA